MFALRQVILISITFSSVITLKKFTRKFFIFLEKNVVANNETLSDNQIYLHICQIRYLYIRAIGFKLDLTEF